MFGSMRVRMVLLFVAFFSLISMSAAATFWVIDTQKRDARVINLAGRQRMLTEQMVKNALLIERGAGEPASLALQRAAAAFQQTLDALIDGGTVPTSSELNGSGDGLVRRDVTLPAARDAELLAALREVERTWEPFHTHLQVVTAAGGESPGFRAAVEGAEYLSTSLLQRADRVVALYEAASARKLARLRWIQAAFLCAALALLAVDLWLIQSQVVRPLRELRGAAGRIGQGDLSTRVDVEGPRELQHLAGSFDLMRAQLGASQEELRAWAQRLEARVEQRTRRLAALQEVSREISSRLEIQDVLQSVTDKAQALLDAEVALLCLLGESGSVLHSRAISGPREALCGDRTLAACEPVSRVLAADGALPCGGSECAECCAIVAPAFRASHLVAPLRSGDRVIGALCVGGSEARSFSAEATDVLTELAMSAAIALENARLYEQAERVATLEERQRLAMEMHDGLAQMVSYLGLKTEQATDLVEAGRESEALGDLHRLRDVIEQASREVRRSIANLQQEHAPRRALQDQLAAAVEEFSCEGGPPVRLALGPELPLFLARAQSEQVLRVVWESLRNARRHAQARQVAVRLDAQGSDVTVAVEDDGQGFDPSLPAQDGGMHFGLSIMRARAARLGGQLAVDSAPGQGTRVMLTWRAEPEPSSLRRALPHREEGEGKR